MGIKSTFAAVCLLAASASAGSAATLDVVNGELRGASGVSVGGSLFDVSFLDGTCAALFAGCDAVTDFAFQTQVDAELAAQALLDQVFLDGPEGNFDSDPEATRGIDNTSQGSFGIPFGFLASGTALSANAFNASGAAGDSVESAALNRTFDTRIASIAAFAVFSASSATPIPVPAGGLLLLTALAGFAAVRRRSRSL